MTPTQSRMARAGLKWSLTDLAEQAKVGRATVARFELGEPVGEKIVGAMRKSMERERVKFVDEGPLAGAVVMGLRKAP